MNFIDIFCGCGGFSSGFKGAGFTPILGIDVWKDAILTYNNNFKEALTINQDIEELTPEEIIKSSNLNIEEIDIIIGGPPCQGFSISGNRMIDDPRNRLYKQFVNLVNYVRPNVFVMENVLGLVKLFKGQIVEQVIDDFTNVGYNVSYQIINSADFGVPQIRKRVFFVGVRKDLNNKHFEFPLKTHGVGLKKYVTCEDAISDLPPISNPNEIMEENNYISEPLTEYQKMIRNTATTVYNHIATKHNEKTIEIIKMVPDGGNYKNLPKDLWNTRKVNIAWTRMNSKKPSFTIDTGHNHHFHYKENRVPTVRESARIQSFDDSFVFYGTKTSQLKQVGNAVPPLVAKAIALKIKEMLKNV